jgi:hypothetical protein
VEFDDRVAEERNAKKARQREERFREARRMTADQLRQTKRSGVVAAIKPLVSGDACRLCLAVRRKTFPIDQCTVEMLPPYEDCEFEEGCESSIEEVLTPKYGGPPRGNRRNTGKAVTKQGGCLGVALMIVMLVSVMIALS